MCLLVSVNFSIHTDNEGRSEREVIVRDGCIHKRVCVCVLFLVQGCFCSYMYINQQGSITQCQFSNVCGGFFP